MNQIPSNIESNKKLDHHTPFNKTITPPSHQTNKNHNPPSPEIEIEISFHSCVSCYYDNDIMNFLVIIPIPINCFHRRGIDSTSNSRVI